MWLVNEDVCKIIHLGFITAFVSNIEVLPEEAVVAAYVVDYNGIGSSGIRIGEEVFRCEKSSDSLLNRR
jgi:hypothetical protein